jgi:hypothetical protein
MEERGLTPSQWQALSRADRLEMLAYLYWKDRRQIEHLQAQAGN